MELNGKPVLQATVRDITERKQLEQQLSRRLHHLEVMERITQISLNSKNIDELLERVLDEILAVFNADRAWFLFPCDPDAPSWSVPMERTRPEWPGAFVRGMLIPMTPEVAEVMREMLASTKPLPYGPVASRYIPAAVAEQFSIRSQIQMALHPRVGSPWLFGLHHCAQARAYDEDELQLFNDIGQRVADALSSMIILKSLRESEQKFMQFFMQVPIPLGVVNKDGVIIYYNDRFTKVFGYTTDEIPTLKEWWQLAYPEESYRQWVMDSWSAAVTKAAKEGTDIEPAEYRVTCKSGAERIVMIGGILLEGNVLATFVDITERKADEEKIQRLTQLYATLSQCNQAIVRCTNEAELFPQICRNVVQLGGMKTAWVGLREPDTQMVRSLASFGDDAGQLQGIEISAAAGNPFGRGLTGAAIRENRPYWCQDFQHDPLCAPWHESGVRAGWASSAALPLRRNGAVVGALTLYADKVNAFDDDVRKLLVEMATDISYAMNNFAYEARRKRAENEARLLTQRITLATDAAAIGIWDWHLKTDQWFATSTYFTMLGYEPEVGFADRAVWLERIYPEDRDAVAEKIRAVLTGNDETYEYEARIRHADGSYRWINVIGRVAGRDENGKAIRMLGVRMDITGRKQAAEALRISALKHRLLFESSRDALMTLTSPSWKFTSANMATLQLFGAASAAEFTALGPWDVSPERQPDGRPSSEKAQEMIAIAMREGSHFFEWEHQRLDNQPFPADVLLTRMEVGEELFLQATVRDITGRKQAEKQLRESAARYKHIIEGLTDYQYTVRVENGQAVDTQHSPGCVTVTGYTAEDFAANPYLWIQIVEPEDRDKVREYVQQILAGKDIPSIEYCIIRKDGEARWVRDTIILFKDASGNLQSYDGVIKDITVRKLAEMVLRQERDRSQKYLDTVQSFMVALDTAGRITMINRAGCELLGYEEGELLGRNWFECCIPQSVEADEIPAVFQRIMAGELSLVEYYENAVLCRDHTRRMIAWHNACLADDAGHVVGTLSSGQDITERKAAEEQIQRHITQLETAVMGTVRVAGTLSEMRDPYTAGHERRVAELAAVIGGELGWDARRLEGLRVAGLLHDVGKISIPAEILAKPGKITLAEYTLVKDHAQAGYDALKDVGFLWPVAEVAWQHHERMDGSGYPRGLKGDEILLEARIMTVADVVEAMASHRPYRPGHGIDKALEEIERGSGSVYDTAVAEACLRLFRDKGYVLPF